jgi:homoserine trans-succinylase
MPSGVNANDMKRNIMLCLNVELISKTGKLGFRLSKTFENHLKHLINHFQNVYSVNNDGNTVTGSPGEIRTLVSGSKARYACPLHHRASQSKFELTF